KPEPQSRIAAPKHAPNNSPTVRVTGIGAFSRLEPASDGPVLQVPEYAGKCPVASAKHSNRVDSKTGAVPHIVHPGFRPADLSIRSANVTTMRVCTIIE